MTDRELELIRLMRKVFGEEKSRPIENLLHKLEIELQKPEKDISPNNR